MELIAMRWRRGCWRGGLRRALGTRTWAGCGVCPIRRRPADQLSEQEVLEYLADLARHGRSGSTVNQAVSAIKFFYGEVVKREWALKHALPACAAEAAGDPES